MDVDGKMVGLERTTVHHHWRWREAVLDRYFTEINVEKIPDEQAGWNKISSLLKAWYQLFRKPLCRFKVLKHS
jgi:hypothetical protein